MHPDTPAEGQDLAEMFAAHGYRFDIQAAHARLAALCAEEGLAFSPQPRIYSSRLAQELASWAAKEHPDAPVHARLFRAYFVDGLNISSLADLLAIVRELGLPADAAEEALRSRRFGPTVDADWQRAAQLGLTGVPTFVIGERGIVGAQPYDVLQRFAEAAGVGRRPLG